MWKVVTEPYQTQGERGATHKSRTFLYLGGVCEVCGCPDWQVLELHHDDNGNLRLLCANHHILADIKDGTSNRGQIWKHLYSCNDKWLV